MTRCPDPPPGPARRLSTFVGKLVTAGGTRSGDHTFKGSDGEPRILVHEVREGEFTRCTGETARSIDDDGLFSDLDQFAGDHRGRRTRMPGNQRIPIGRGEDQRADPLRRIGRGVAEIDSALEIVSEATELSRYTPADAVDLNRGGGVRF